MIITWLLGLIPWTLIRRAELARLRVLAATTDERIAALTDQRITEWWRKATARERELMKRWAE